MKNESVDAFIKRVDDMVRRIESDERYGYPSTRVDVNARLTLIQVEMKAQVRALKWVLYGTPIGTSSASVRP